ncbi:MAG: DUF1573 domain-containing protein [Saprospiraceae bacterium]
MKQLLSVLTLLVLAFTFATAQNETTPVLRAQPAQVVENAATDGPAMKFETLQVDYGTIIQDSDPYRYFKFTNVGTEPAVIKTAKGSCGCTVPTYPKEPILPGQTAEIKVRYDTKRVGPFTKRVTLTTNTAEPEIVLTIKGVVEKKPEEPAGLPTQDNGLFNNNNNN